MTTMMEISPTETAVLVFVSTLLYVTWRWLRWHWEHKKPFGDDLPMPPGSHFILGHLGTTYFGRDFRNVMKGMAVDYADDYGVSSFWMTSNKAVSVSSWQDARTVLQSSTDRKRPKILQVHLNHFLGPRNIGALRGKEWKYHRAAILRVFHSSETLRQSRSAMVDVAQTLVQSLIEQQQQQPQQQRSNDSLLQVIDMEPLMKMITMDVFGRTALSYDFGCCSSLTLSPLAAAFDYLGNELIRRARRPLVFTNALYDLPTPANRRHKYERHLIRNFLEQRIEERRGRRQQQNGATDHECTVASSSSCDLLTSLLKAHAEMSNNNWKGDQTMAAAQHVTDLTLVDIMMSLLFAGYDTTSITLTYALYFVATMPHVEEYCLEEIARVARQNSNGDDKETLDPDRLVYCRAVITETLRLYPPGVNVTRTTTRPIELSNGFVVPQDTFVNIPIYVIQRHAKHFPRPNEFLPERWAQRSGEVWVEREHNDDDNNDNDDDTLCSDGKDDHNVNVPAGNHNAFFAFSAGARSCAAQKFALQEAVLVLATLVKQLKFTIQDGYVLEPKRNGIVQSPRNGMPMTVVPRS